MTLCAAATLAPAAPEAPKAPAAPPAAPAPPPPGRGTFNPELPPSVEKSLDALASNNVLGPIIVIQLFIIAVLSLVLYLGRNKLDKALTARDRAHAAAWDEREKDWNAERSGWAAEASQLQESRLALLERVMTVAGNATAVMQMQVATNNERTASQEKMTEALRDFLAQANASRSSLQDALADIRKQAAETTRAVQKLSQRGSGP